jgi:hypothetical protein
VARAEGQHFDCGRLKRLRADFSVIRRKRITTQPGELQTQSAQEGRIIHKVASPQAPWFLAKSMSPLQTGILDPRRSISHAANVIVKCADFRRKRSGEIGFGVPAQGRTHLPYVSVLKAADPNCGYAISEVRNARLKLLPNSDRAEPSITPMHTRDTDMPWVPARTASSIALTAKGNLLHLRQPQACWHED